MPRRVYFITLRRRWGVAEILFGRRRVGAGGRSQSQEKAITLALESAQSQARIPIRRLSSRLSSEGNITLQGLNWFRGRIAWLNCFQTHLSAWCSTSLIVRMDILRFRNIVLDGHNPRPS